MSPQVCFVIFSVFGITVQCVLFLFLGTSWLHCLLRPPSVWLLLYFRAMGMRAMRKDVALDVFLDPTGVQVHTLAVKERVLIHPHIQLC